MGGRSINFPTNYSDAIKAAALPQSRTLHAVAAAIISCSLELLFSYKIVFFL
jgi:hypothetical protein